MLHCQVAIAQPENQCRWHPTWAKLHRLPKLQTRRSSVSHLLHAPHEDVSICLRNDEAYSAAKLGNASSRLGVG